jgi:excisionase family DNA binding protein
MDHQATVNALAERVAKLEAKKAEKRVFNQQEAARELGMSVNRLRREIHAGRISGRKRGRIWTFTNADLEAYLATDDVT